MSLICTTQPAESGLHLDQARISAVKVNAGGKEDTAWVSGYKSVPADDWARSFCITVTDDKYRQGKMPVVDVDVTFMHEANTKVELVADTAKGSRVIARAWGNKHELQTIHCQLDDAFFGSRNPGNDAKTLPADGFDLRLNAWAGDFYLKSVTLKAHDPSDPDDWSRFLTLGDVTSNSNFIVAPGASDQLTFPVTNRAKIMAQGTATIEVVDGSGKIASTSNQKLSVPAGETQSIPASFDASALTGGEYVVRVNIKCGSNIIRGEQSVVVAGPNDLFIIFDKTPIARGIDFDRVAISPQQVTVDGVPNWVWSAGYNSQRGGDSWWHSVCMKVTDPRFQNGAMPAADVRVTYRHEANAPVSCFADTSAGSRQVGFGWGRNPNWQTMAFKLDDAKFAQTDYQDPAKDLKSDGFDLRFNACTGDAQIRSVFIHGYDLDHSPDFDRLVRFDGIDTGRELFIFSPGEKQTLQLKLRNLAHPDLVADSRIWLTDDLGNEIWNRQQPVTIRGGGPIELPVPFDTAGLKQGVYTLGLELNHVDSKGMKKTIVSSSWNLMVSESSPIPKAKDGEFMYGVDTGIDYKDERWMKWLDFMGCDITRGNGANQGTGDWASAFAAFDKHDLRNTVFADIPWDDDAVKRQQKVQEVADRAEAAARLFGDRAHFWELGNEPDLTFFYPGPIEEYARGFSIVSRAIRRGNPNSVVMNGGLCFATPDADRRARKFVEVVDTNDIQGFAYHGHGPLIAAERGAFDRVHDLAKHWNKADRIFMETESGVSARTPGQIRIQARTAVEKMVFAQSVGEPAFMWFRLNIQGGDGDYTSTTNTHEPRPVVLSYRTMSRLLKGLSFVRKLDLGSNDLQAYLFAAKNADSRAMVVWSDTSGGASRTIRIGTKAGDASKVRQLDLFGNVTPVSDVDSGLVTVPVELDPSYLEWKSDEAPDAVDVVPSPLRLDPVLTVSRGMKDSITVHLSNSLDHALDATLTITTGAGSGVTPEKSQIQVAIPAHGKIDLPIPVTVQGAGDAVNWPANWTVFAPVPANRVDLHLYNSSVPNQLQAGDEVIRPQFARLKDDRIDIASMGGGFAEKKEAVLFATIDSPIDQVIRIGSSADWWEEWFVNGRSVYDDLESGNLGPQSILEHPFQARLKAGRNLLAVRVLSGLQGWKLWCGGPQEIAAAKGALTGGGSMLNVELRQGMNVLGRERARIAFRKPLREPATGQFDAPLESWSSIEPDADLGEGNILNEFVRQPDAGKWWQGPADLSARAWFRADNQHFTAVVAVKDDVNKPATSAETIDIGDSIRITFVDPVTGVSLELAVPGSGATVYQRLDHRWVPVAGTDAHATVDRVESPSGGVTWYRVRLARTILRPHRLAINMSVIDNDFGVRKQTAAWFAGMEHPGADSKFWWQAEMK